MALQGSDLGRSVWAAAPGRGRRGGLAAVVRIALASAPLWLAGCGATESIGSKLLLGNAEPKEMDPALYANTPVCPTVEIRDGTEFMPVFEPAKPGEQPGVRFQASVQRAARDCDETAAGIRVRVGVAGRVLSGAKGATGSLSVPVRVAALAGDKLLYSKVTTATVDVQAPDYSALWSIVDDAVVLSVADSREVTIYVGLDGKVDPRAPKGGKPAKKLVTK